MDSKILLGKIPQRFTDQGFAQVKGLNKFTYVKGTDTYVEVLRQKGTKDKIYFTKLIDAIGFYKQNVNAYDEGPSALRRIPMTHITSPVFAMLHLLPAASYKEYQNKK